MVYTRSHFKRVLRPRSPLVSANKAQRKPTRKSIISKSKPSPYSKRVAVVKKPPVARKVFTQNRTQAARAKPAVNRRPNFAAPKLLTPVAIQVKPLPSIEKTRIIMLLDKTGSMRHFETDTINSYNSWLDSNKITFPDEKHAPRFDRVLFSTDRKSETFEDINDAPNLTAAAYACGRVLVRRCRGGGRRSA